MQKSKSVTLFIIIIIFLYFLFSQFYLRTLGNINTYIINPLFFVVLVLILKFTIQPTYKTDKYKKSIVSYVLVTITLYAVVFFASGIFLTYGNNPYANTINGIALNLYSVGLVVVCIEYIRFKLINNSLNKTSIFIIIVLTFALKDIPLNSLINNLNFYSLFKFLFINVIPSIIKSILFTYIAKYTDYKPAIIYQLLLYLVLWVPPVLPNAPWVFTSIIDILFPLVLLLYCIYEISSKDKLHLYKSAHPIEPRGLIPLTAGIVLAIWFALGIFPIKPIGIATGSMKPTINVGDLVVIKKCNANDVNENDIIEYQREDFSVIHRVVEKYQKDGEIFFITKGDNNNHADSDPVSEQKLKGKVIFKIPYLALPTIWLDSLSGKQSSVDIETGN